MRTRILDAARHEFASCGLAGASVRAIGRRAGVTAAMINYYFRGKRALYDEVVDEAQRRLQQRLERALAEGPSEPDEDLALRLTEAYFDFLSAEQDLQRLMMREVLDRSESVADYTRRYLAPLRPLLASFADPEEAFQLAVSIFGAVAGYFLYEPVLAELMADHPLSTERLEARRRHLRDLVPRLVTSRPTTM